MTVYVIYCYKGGEEMEKVQDMSQHCGKCQVPIQYKNDEITIYQARHTCARCRFSGNGIYKFDIAYSLYDQIQRNKPPAGKGATYTKRYGNAVKQLQAEGKTIREIAKILGISPTSVNKISKELNVPRGTD